MEIGLSDLFAPSAVMIHLSELGQKLGSYFCADTERGNQLVCHDSRIKAIVDSRQHYHKLVPTETGYDILFTHASA